MSLLETELSELRLKLREAECSYLVSCVSVLDGALYLRVDTGDNTVKENESRYYDLCEDFRSIGYTIVDACIEYDCISAAVLKSLPTVSSSLFSVNIQAQGPAPSKAKVSAWCESLAKGAQRCRESCNNGDAETLDDIAAYFRNLVKDATTPNATNSELE